MKSCDHLVPMMYKVSSTEITGVPERFLRGIVVKSSMDMTLLSIP